VARTTPTLRSDLIISRQAAGGGTSFVIKDPATGQFFRFRANSPTVSNLALPMRSRSVWGRAFVVGGFSSE